MLVIVIFGATGSVGPELVRTLAAQGRRVRVATRDPERARRLVGADVEVVRADLLDEASVAPAVAGAEAVFCGVGGATGTPELVRVVSALADRCAEARVRRFVHVGGIDSHVSREARIQAWHQDIGRHLSAIGLPHTTLHPNFFDQNLLGLAPAVAQGVLPLPTGEARCSMIDARDLAHVAAKVLAEDGHEGAHYTLTGPEAVSHGEVAHALSELLGRRVAFVDVPGPAFAGSLVEAGLPPWFADLLTDVYVSVFAAGRAERVTDDVPRLLGRAARGVPAFLRDHVGAFTA